MTPKTCANSKCDTEFTSVYPDKKYCSSTCKNREKSRRHREANPEKTREGLRKWREANLERERERVRKWREANPERNREVNLENDRKWREANPEKAREGARKWREANPEKYLEGGREKNRKWREANPEKKRESSRRWYEANREKNCERSRERSLKRYYEKTKPRGIILDQRLWDMFQRQALRDPNGLPELAERVLEWKPKGFAAEKTFAVRNGTTERDWMYYIELTPEEATMQWQDEAAQLEAA